MSRIVPTGEPSERRRFQLTNLDGNNNKFYLVETWPQPDGTILMRASYGRVGSSPQVADAVVPNAAAVERKIREKTNKGYQEVTLHRPAVEVAEEPEADTKLDSRVREVIDFIYAEAGEKIASYLAVGVDGLSPEQIARGRKLLQLAQSQHGAWQKGQKAAEAQLLAGTVQSYYNAIPTQLPGRIERDQVITDFCKAFDEQEDRLNQLEAAVATLNVQKSAPQTSRYDALGAHVELLPSGHSAYGEVTDYIARTCVHGYKVKVRDIFTITVPGERATWEENLRGRSRMELLFHGTAGHNVRHILRTGLMCPKTASNGRMFGHGVYFANQCTKSANYCHSSGRGVPHFLFLAEVAIGDVFIAPRAMSDLRDAPKGHDSVLGKAGQTDAWGGKLQHDEHIIYSAAQQTLRYLVTFDK